MGDRVRTHPYGHGARPMGDGGGGRLVRAPVARPDLTGVPVALRAYVEYIEQTLTEERAVRAKERYLESWAETARQQTRSGGTI